MSCNGDEECDIRPGTVTPKKLPKQSGGGGHEFVTELPEKGDEGVEYVLMTDISDCATYQGTYVYNEECEGWIATSGSGGGGAVERYTFETTDTGWRAKRNNTVVFTYVDKDTIDSYEETATGFQIIRNGSVIFSHDDKVTVVPVYTAEATTTGWVLKKDGTTIFTYDDKNNEYTIEDTDTGWVFKENGVIKYTYTEPADTPSDGTYFASGELTEVITGTTTVAVSAVTGLNIADVVIGETLIYDEAGTVGRVTAVNGTDLTVETITTSPGERRGTRLGAVDDHTDLPATCADAVALGWQTPLAGDFAYVREDSAYDDHLTEYVIQNIDASCNITWGYSHTLNAGNYVLDVYKYGDYPSGNPIPKNADGSITLPKDENTKYDFETVTDATGKITGWKVKDHDTGTTLYTYTDQNDDTNTEYVFEDTDNGWRVKDKATGGVLYTHVDTGDTTYDFEAVTVGGKITGWRVKDGDTGTVLFTYNDLNDLSDGAYFTSETLDDGITNTTSVGVSTVSGLLVSDVVDGETLIYDGEGTLGVVTAHTTTALTVTTMTTAGGSGTTYTFKNIADGWQATNDKTGGTFLHADKSAGLVDVANVHTTQKKYFVDSDNGDDVNGDGSVDHPFRTIQAAINLIPPQFQRSAEYPAYSLADFIYVNCSATNVYEPIYFENRAPVEIRSYDPSKTTSDIDIFEDSRTATLKITATAYKNPTFGDGNTADIVPSAIYLRHSEVYLRPANVIVNQAAGATAVNILESAYFEHGYSQWETTDKHTFTVNANNIATRTWTCLDKDTGKWVTYDAPNQGSTGISVSINSHAFFRGYAGTGSVVTVNASCWGIGIDYNSTIHFRWSVTVVGGSSVNQGNYGAMYTNNCSAAIFDEYGASASNICALNFTSQGKSSCVTVTRNAAFQASNTYTRFYCNQTRTDVVSAAVIASQGGHIRLAGYNYFYVRCQTPGFQAIQAAGHGTITIYFGNIGTQTVIASTSTSTNNGAIYAGEGGRISIYGGSGTALPTLTGRYGYRAVNGGQITYTNIGTFSGTTQREASSGGRIYTGNQNTIGSY